MKITHENGLKVKTYKSGVVLKYNNKKKLVYWFIPDEFVTTYDWDDRGNMIHSITKDLYNLGLDEEKWVEYDDQNHITHLKTDKGFEYWIDTDETGIHYHDSDGKRRTLYAEDMWGIEV